MAPPRASRSPTTPTNVRGDDARPHGPAQRRCRQHEGGTPVHDSTAVSAAGRAAYPFQVCGTLGRGCELLTCGPMYRGRGGLLLGRIPDALTAYAPHGL